MLRRRKEKTTGFKPSEVHYYCPTLEVRKVNELFSPRVIRENAASQVLDLGLLAFMTVRQHISLALTWWLVLGYISRKPAKMSI